MSFTDNLANTSGSGIYGGVGPSNGADSILSFISRVNDMKMNAYKNKAAFDTNLQNQQAGLRRAFDPGQQSNTMGQPVKPPMNVVQQADPNQMQNENQIPALAKMELGVKNKQLDVNSQRLNQQANFQNQTLGIRNRQEQLNEQKSDQINDLKSQDLQRKIDDSTKKYDAAANALKQKDMDVDKTLAAHKAIADAVEERHKAEQAMKDYQFEQTHSQMQQKIDDLAEQVKQRGRSTVTSKQGDQTRTVTTEKGTAADRVQAIGKDGKTYTIPADKLNDKDADGSPHWKPVGGGNDNNNDGGDNNNDGGDEGEE